MSTPTTNTPAARPGRTASFARPGGAPATPVVDIESSVAPAATVAGGLDLATVSKDVGARPYHAPGTLSKPARPLFSDEDTDIDFDELRLPAINLTQKVGDLSNIFPPGSVILGKEHMILEPPPMGEGKVQEKPLVVYIIAFRPTRWTEKVEGGARGNLFDTREQVANAGGTTDYNENKRNPEVSLYQELATALLLVEKPEEADDALFAFEAPNGKKYALALWNMKGSAYTDGAKIIKSARKIGYPFAPMKGRFLGCALNLRTTLKKFQSGFSAFKPSLSVGEVTTAEFRRFVHDCAGLEPNPADAAVAAPAAAPVDDTAATVG